jgi:hypothetical protein
MTVATGNTKHFEPLGVRCLKPWDPGSTPGRISRADDGSSAARTRVPRSRPSLPDSPRRRAAQRPLPREPHARQPHRPGPPVRHGSARTRAGRMPIVIGSRSNEAIVLRASSTGSHDSDGRDEDYVATHKRTKRRPDVRAGRSVTRGPDITCDELERPAADGQTGQSCDLGGTWMCSRAEAGRVSPPMSALDDALAAPTGARARLRGP